MRLAPARRDAADEGAHPSTGARRAGGAACLLIVLLWPQQAGSQAPTPPFTTNEGAPASSVPLPRRPAADVRADAVQRLLEGSGAVADVPVAVATFPLSPPASGPSAVLIATEIGARQILPDSLFIGLRVTDASGRVAFNGTDEHTVSPAAPDAASPLLYVAEVRLAPGVYRLRVAVVDSAGRVAAVDHPFEVPSARAAEPFRAGSLMIGLAAAGGAIAPLARGGILRAGAMAWMEIGAAEVGPSARARVEVQDGPDGPMLTEAGASFDPPGTPRRLVRARLPVALLPPGAYVARLVIEDGSHTATRVRPFTLGRLPPPDAAAVGEVVTSGVGPFTVADVLEPAVLGPVLGRAVESDPTGADDLTRAAVARVQASGVRDLDVKPFAKRRDLAALMIKGAVLLDKGSLEDAANAFRDALRASSEFLPAIVYLGACYAAGGRDREAVGAWQTALVTETDTPLVFRLAADGLIRLGDSAQAVSLLAEAAERWPNEASLVTRHAMALAAREGPARAVDALLPALERAGHADSGLLTVAARLAIASATRDDEGAAARVSRVRAVAARSGPVPPLLERWNLYLRTR